VGNSQDIPSSDVPPRFADTPAASPVRALTRRPRLTVLVASNQRRGAEIFGEQLSERLPEMGWDVDFVALTEAAPGSPRVSARVLVPHRILGPLDWKVVRALRDRVGHDRADIVLANGSSTLRYAVIAARTLRRRPLVAYASIGDPTYWATTARRRIQYRALLARTDRVLSVSSTTASRTVDAFHLPPDHVVVAQIGVDERFLHLRPTGEAGAIRLLFLGSLSREKDPVTAVRVAALVAQVREMKLRFVGRGDMSDEVREAAETLAISAAVEMVGSVDDVAPSLEWAHVLLLTSRTEGLPAATLEAAAAGLPVVAFDVGGVAETVRHGESGFLVPPGDVEGAARAVLALGDERLRRAKGRAGRAHVMSAFTLTHAVARYDSALKAMLEAADV
jgi:glycosyltransferase involved in cell wall biosynthesis